MWAIDVIYGAGPKSVMFLRLLICGFGDLDDLDDRSDLWSWTKQPYVIYVFNLFEIA